jgi:AraC-like DNA-binding protein
MKIPQNRLKMMFKDVAKRTAKSITTLPRPFHPTTGETFMTYITNLKKLTHRKTQLNQLVGEVYS